MAISTKILYKLSEMVQIFHNMALYQTRVLHYAADMVKCYAKAD